MAAVYSEWNKRKVNTKLLQWFVIMKERTDGYVKIHSLQRKIKTILDRFTINKIVLQIHISNKSSWYRNNQVVLISVSNHLPYHINAIHVNNSVLV